ncbi:MAG: divalent-cation tolerance protein CutA [Myxococcota bacterium]
MSRSESDVCVVLITAPDGDTAAGIGRTLVEERLAACVNVVPGVRSLYRWQGSVREDVELLLFVKTRVDRMPALAARVRELHPYDVPEVLALPAVGGSEEYLDWVRSESSS